MKNKVLRGKVYSKLIWRLFYQTVAILVAAFVLVIILLTMLRGKFANFMVQLIGILWGVDWDKSQIMYISYIRNNFNLIIITTMLVLFFLLLRLSFSWFARYFDQIVTGVDKLAEEADEPIVMSSELNFIETKLNEVKDKLKKRTEKAQYEEQQKNALVVYLAHDIKTPLTSVIGYLSLLNESPDMPTEQKVKYVGIALKKACRLEKLISEFFEITRYNLQHVPLDIKSINLCYMMVQVTDEAYPQLVEKGKQIKIDVEENITIYGDSEKLARVFNNILKNAIAYSYDNSTIRITAEAKPDKTVIHFENKGAIPKEQLNSIFDKFYRLDVARSSATGGAGLGLAIAKDIVSLHGGVIRAESDMDCTTFTVELPVNSKPTSTP